MPYVGEISAIISAFAFSACALFFTSASHRIGSFSMSHFRMLFATVMLVIIQLILTGRLFPAEMSLVNWLLLAMSGLTGFFMCDALLFQSYVDSSPRIGVLIFNIYPFVGALFAWVFLKEVLSFGAVIGITITMGGIVWVALERGDGNIHLHKRHYARGMILASGAGILQGISFVLAKPSMEGEGSADPLTATLIRAMFGGAAFWAVSLVRGRLRGIVRKSSNSRAMLATFFGAVVGFIGVWLSMIAVKLAPVGIATTLIAMMPVTILPMTAIVHRERISWRAIIGAIVACLGVAILFNA